MGKPLVSVCIPAFNAEKTIGKTINSILTQTYTNIEIIVSDNYSNDNTKKIVKSYEKSGVRYELNPKHPDDLKDVSSVVSNFNYVISLAKGEFIAIFHADDIYDSTIIEQEVNFLMNNPETSSVFTSSNQIDENENVLNTKIDDFANQNNNIKNIINFETLLNDIILSEYHLMFPSLMIKSEALIHVGYFNPNESFVSDIEYYLRLARWKPIGYIDKKLLFYRTDLSNNKVSIERQIKVIEHYVKFIENYISTPEIEIHIDKRRIDFFKMVICSRKIFLARYYFLEKNKLMARKELTSFKLKYILLSLYYKKSIQSMIIGSILLIADGLGIAFLISKILMKLKDLRFTIWKKTLIVN